MEELEIRRPLAYSVAQTEAKDAVSLTPLCLARVFGADNPQTACSPEETTTIIDVHRPNAA